MPTSKLVTVFQMVNTVSLRLETFWPKIPAFATGGHSRALALSKSVGVCRWDASRSHVCGDHQGQRHPQSYGTLQFSHSIRWFRPRTRMWPLGSGQELATFPGVEHAPSKVQTTQPPTVSSLFQGEAVAGVCPVACGMSRVASAWDTAKNFSTWASPWIFAGLSSSLSLRCVSTDLSRSLPACQFLIGRHQCSALSHSDPASSPDPL